MQTVRTVYISGPMTGYPADNHPSFHAAASRLREHGFVAVNPADNFGGQRGLPFETYMRLDLSHVLAADAVVVLPGWEHSKGACTEVAVALAVGTPVLDLEHLEKLPLVLEAVGGGNLSLRGEAVA